MTVHHPDTAKLDPSPATDGTAPSPADQRHAGQRNGGRRRIGSFRRGVIAAGLIFLAAGCAPDEAGNVMSDTEVGQEALGPSGLRIVSLSTRPHLVTGGDVLLGIEAGANVETNGVRVEVDGADVTSSFRLAPIGAGQASVGGDALLVGYVDGLSDGSHRITATAPGADDEAVLEVTSYPTSGPIISGPHEEPFVCQTEEFEVAEGTAGMLGAPLDDDCSVETRVDYVYWPAPGGAMGEGDESPGDDDRDFLPYDPTDPPESSAIATAQTLHGEEVPFIVRVETGTVNRAVYEIALLHDPADPEPDPWSHSRGWNGKVVYTHGGGCRSGWYQQGSGTGGVLRDGLLDMGYAVITTSLNVFGQNCNDLLASESHIMLKERFVERYGVPVYTIATGGSGGSYQSHQTADNYPGVFDGIIVSSSFPDVTSATIFTLADARLLHHYFTATAPDLFTRDQQQAVSGFGSWGSIPNLSRGAARLDPTFEPEDPPEEQGGELSLEVLEEMRYDPETNPDGIRATVYDHTVNVYGLADEPGPAGTPVAARPLDNVGVQYGLGALDAGTITVDQFLDLNRRIGGFDRDLNHVPERHAADPAAAEHALATGRILYGGGGLATTPIMDYRTYTDHREGGDIHMIVHQFSTRARLMAANGHTDNHVMTVGGCWGFSEECPDLGVLFRQMDEWIEGIQEDESDAPQSEKVVAAKPTGVRDQCWADGLSPQGNRMRFLEPLSFGSRTQCGQIYPAYPTPRQVAGGPLSNDIVTCVLAPPVRDDYAVEFSDAQWQELQEIFPDGVCDWSQGDAHDVRYAGTWLSFGPSPVNRVE